MDHGVLVYRSSLRKFDTSANQVCASLDKVCASGKLLSLRAAGSGAGCGHSTAGGVGFEAHPLKLARQIIDVAKSGITQRPRFRELLDG